MCHVYKIVFPDSRVYIGITKNFNIRLKQHARSKQLCGKLIRKFGTCNIQYSSIFEGTLAECLEIEECLVDSVWLKNWRCVNMAIGGNAGAAFSGHKHTAKSKSAISASLVGRIFSDEHKRRIGVAATQRFSCIPLTEEHKQNISAGLLLSYMNTTKESRRLRSAYLGKTRTPETKAKISAAHMKGADHHNARPVIMTDRSGLETEFGSIAIASRALARGSDSIFKALNGKAKSAYGCTWKYKNIKRT